MRIICPQHAQDRLKERQISRSQVERALRHPWCSLPTKSKRRKRIMADIDNKTLDVIFEERPSGDIILVTAVWLKKENRKICPSNRLQ